MTLDEARQSIRHELESLRASGAHRRELSLHACKRLFFDLGIRPSMAAVRDLTQTGSASDIPKDIEHFWERIRDASRVRVGSGAIPSALEEKAGELLGALFEAALSEARQTLDEQRAQMLEDVRNAERQLQEAEIRRDATDQALRRSEARADAALTRARDFEAELARAATQQSSGQEALLANVLRLEKDNEGLNVRLENEQVTNAALRERIDTLQAEMRQNAEHYAAQIKDAIADAERRVKPMLVELDSLRNMAATYQGGIRDANRKEFDFIQQLSAAKGRADRLEAQVRSQSDEIDSLMREVDGLRARGTVAPELAALVRSLSDSGRLDSNDLARVGTSLDAYVSLPAHCPKCGEGEPELARAGADYELLCPECNHSSGTMRSRLEAVSRFMSDKGTASPDVSA